MELQDQIRIARERIGLSQDELADKMNVSRTAVDNWETGAVPRKEKLLMLQEILGVTLYVTGTPGPSEKGNPYGFTPDEIELFIALKNLPLESREAVTRIIKAMSAALRTGNEKTSRGAFVMQVDARGNKTVITDSGLGTKAKATVSGIGNSRSQRRVANGKK